MSDPGHSLLGEEGFFLPHCRGCRQAKMPGTMWTCIECEQKLSFIKCQSYNLC